MTAMVAAFVVAAAGECGGRERWRVAGKWGGTQLCARRARATASALGSFLSRRLFFLSFCARLRPVNGTCSLWPPCQLCSLSAHQICLSPARLCPRCACVDFCTKKRGGGSGWATPARRRRLGPRRSRTPHKAGPWAPPPRPTARFDGGGHGHASPHSSAHHQKTRGRGSFVPPCRPTLTSSIEKTKGTKRGGTKRGGSDSIRLACVTRYVAAPTCQPGEG